MHTRLLRASLALGERAPRPSPKGAFGGTAGVRIKLHYSPHFGIRQFKLRVTHLSKLFKDETGDATASGASHTAA
jgi:hypothetical protein